MGFVLLKEGCAENISFSRSGVTRVKKTGYVARVMAVLMSLTMLMLPVTLFAQQTQKPNQVAHKSKLAVKKTSEKKLKKAADVKKIKKIAIVQKKKNVKKAVEKTAILAKNAKKSPSQKVTKSKSRTRLVMAKARKKGGRTSARRVVRSRPTFGQQAGLHRAYDPLNLKSSSVFIRDVDTGEILFQKNADEVLPIASITKLMLGVVVAQARLPMDHVVVIDRSDTRLSSTARSRLAVGMPFTRAQLMDLALMASENRAAHALARSYPGGLEKAVDAMNQKAQELGMINTKYEEPTGLSNLNRSTVVDLVKLVSYASQNSLVSHSSTLPAASFAVGNRLVNYRSTNRMIASGNWEIEAQKTGFISDAGQCLVMQAKIGGRRLGIALLDGVGHLARTVDSERIRAWVEGRLDGLDQNSFVSAKTTADRFDYAPGDWDLPVHVVLQQEMSADDFARLSLGDLNDPYSEDVALEMVNQEDGSDEVSDDVGGVVVANESPKKESIKPTAMTADSAQTSFVVNTKNNSKKTLATKNTAQVLPDVAASQYSDNDIKKENSLIQKVKNVFIPASISVRPASADKKVLQIQ